MAVLVLTLVTAAAFCFLEFSRGVMPIWCTPLPLQAALVSSRKYSRQRLQIWNFVRLRRFYAGSVERLEGSWIANGITGEEFEMPNHTYAADLNLFGRGSLFERLCTAPTHLGCERLASYLQGPASFDEIRQRRSAALLIIR